MYGGIARKRDNEKNKEPMRKRKTKKNDSEIERYISLLNTKFSNVSIVKSMAACSMFSVIYIYYIHIMVFILDGCSFRVAHP